jgi:phage/plasmid-associated DNA primase
MKNSQLELLFINKHTDEFRIDKMKDLNNLSRMTENVFNINVNYNIVNNYISTDKIEFENVQIFDDSKLNNLIARSLDGTIYKIAEVLYYLNKDNFNFGEDNKWYEFKNHRWTKSNGLKSFVSKLLVKYYNKVIEYYKLNINEERKINQINKIIDDLKSTNYTNNIIKESEETFKSENNINDDFVENLDTNIYLLGFNNGVYDLNKNEFRNGKPSDNISYTVGYDYNEQSEYNDNVIEMINTILPNESVRNYVLKSMSLCLSGKTIKKVFLWNGVESNGKSMLLNLLALSLGDYYKKLPTNMITKHRYFSENTSCQVMKMNKKRCIVFPKPKKTDKLNFRIIKELSECDMISTIGPNQKLIDIISTFHIFIPCYFSPKSEDHIGIWDRVKNIQFTSKFVDNPNKDNNNEHLINTDLKSKLPMYKESLMILLIKHWKIYQIEGLKNIKEIEDSTK